MYNNYVFYCCRFQRLAQLQPLSQKPLLHMGKLFLRQEKYKRAEEVFRQAVKVDPSHPQSLYALGELFVRIKEYAKAIEWLERLLSVLPSTKLGVALLVEAYQHTNNHDKAEKLLQSSGEIDAANVETYRTLAQQSAARQDVESAKRYYKNALKYDEDNEEILYEFGRFLFQNQQWSEAEQHLSILLRKIKKAAGGEREAAVEAMLDTCRIQQGRDQQETDIGERASKTSVTQNNTKRPSLKTGGACRLYVQLHMRCWSCNVFFSM